MNEIPQVLLDLVAAQNSFDSVAYAECFSETAIVGDEGETHSGKTAIQEWNRATSSKYRTHLELLSVERRRESYFAVMKVSGQFDGSPIKLGYQFQIAAGRISSMAVVDAE